MKNGCEMNEFEKLVEELNHTTFEKIKTWKCQFSGLKEYFELGNHLKKHLPLYKKTGVYIPFNGRQPRSKANTKLKENEAPEPQPEEKRTTRTKTRKAALSEMTNKIAEEIIQPKDLFNIKKEKISDVHVPEKVKPVNEVNVKKEAEEMPAPTQLPKKRKKIKAEPTEVKSPPARTTRTKTRNKKQKEEESSASEPSKNDSDIIIEPEKIVTIDLADEEVSVKETSSRSTRTKTRNDKKAAQTEQQQPIRSTRTKTKEKPATKRSRAESQEEPEQEKKKSRSVSAGSGKTEYEDALSTLDGNATYAVVKSPQNANVTVTLDKLDATVVVEKPKVLTKKEELKKPLFNPCEESPVKKKVEAFEKLSKINAKSKMVTPVNSKALPKTCNSTGVVNRVLNGSTLLGSSESKSRSVLKASQAEFREREKRREMEALKKREAILKAQSEEKRKKREEKHQKAQEQREIIEREKMRMLEQQRQKEERTKQLIAEKEMKLQKQREEQEKRRLQAKEKALKQAKLMEKANGHPIYMITKPPLLPTEDCYDSDDEEYLNRHRVKAPSWASGSELKHMLKVQDCIGEKLKNTYFSRKAVTVDLREIFENIDPQKLKRTSSAIWRKPPRYTMLPLESQPEFSEDEIDEDFD